MLLISLPLILQLKTSANPIFNKITFKSKVDIPHGALNPNPSTKRTKLKRPAVFSEITHREL